MRSPVNWALLGLLIERPSYGYELVQRFARTYGELLKLSSPSRIYTALDSLIRRGMIEVTSGVARSSAPRQPKPHYHATDEGVRRYLEHLIGQVGEEQRRSRLFARELATLTPQAALAVLDQYERMCLAEAARAQPHGSETAARDASPTLADRLTAEEERLAMEAKLPWVDYARRELRAVARRTPR